MNWFGISGTGAGSVSVNVPTREALLADLSAHLSEQRGFSVATLNLDHVVKLRHDPAFRDAYQRHTHVTADGNPIVWLSRLSGQQVSLIPGSELIEPLIEIAARQGTPVGFFGSTDASLEQAAQVLTARYPGLNIAAKISPAMGFDPAGPAADAAIDALSAAGAQLIFLALGAPKQEIFAARAQERMPGAGFLSIGAGIDFISGNQTRAPKWVRRLAAEWLWRLATNPARLARRYGACIAILPGLTLSALRSRRQA